MEHLKARIGQASAPSHTMGNVTYVDAADMRAAIQSIETEINGGTVKPQSVVVILKKNW
jgi:hypothetical protein